MFTIRFSIVFFLALGLSWVSTLFVRAGAMKFKLVDSPDAERKIHQKPIPLFGGFALYAAITISILISWSLGWISDQRVSDSVVIGIFVAGAILMLGGFLDDRYRLPWQLQLIFPVLAIVFILAFGLTMPYVSNPFGTGLLRLDALKIQIPGTGLYLTLANVFLFVWLLGMMYTTKLLDGIDGLASSIAFISSMVIFVVSLFWDRSGSTTSYLAIALAGALIGFLIWNWHPARIFLGEGGSVFLGFMLAILAVLSGGKIATAVLVMGVPILDVLWIIIRRLLAGQQIFRGDNKHLHFRLLRAGLSQQQIVVVLSLVALAFGSISFFFQTRVKVIALIVLVIAMLIFATVFVKRYETKDSSRN